MARSQLQFEASRSLGIARRVGRRLMRWVKQIDGHEIELERIVGRDPETGVDIMETVYSNDLDVHGKRKPIMVPLLPSKDFLQSWELYERTVRNLLQEQRARAAMATKDGAVQVSDEVFDAQIAELARRAIVEMPRAELEALLKERRMNIVAGASAEVPSVTSEDALHATPGAPASPAPTGREAFAEAMKEFDRAIESTEPDILSGFGDADSE